MLSTIERHVVLDALLNSYPEIKEVYANTDFSWEQDYPTFRLLHDGNLDTALFLRKLVDIYPGITNFYAIDNPMSSAFENTKLIWRGGSWYA